MTTEQVMQVARTRALTRSGKAREIRLTAGLSLADLADALEVAPSTVHRIERGEQSPRGELAIRYGVLLENLERTLEAVAS